MSRNPDRSSPSDDRSAGDVPSPGLFLAREGLFRVALVNPEIPPNVGAVSRTCAAAGCPLFLVGQLSFSEDHPARRRAGLDYWDLVEKNRVDNLNALREQYPEAGFHLFSKRGERGLYETVFAEGDFLVFGGETSGLDPELLERHPDEVCRIPMRPGIRSLNVSTAVGVVLYEAIRQVTLNSRTTG